MHEFPRNLRDRLESQYRKSWGRKLSPPSGIDFCSNDYLGFASDDGLRKKINKVVCGLSIGSTGSRLLRGNTEVHNQAEETVARFSTQDAALLYSSGYQANVGLLSSVLAQDDRVYSDAFNHASIIDGVRLSGCHKQIYHHLNLGHLELLLEEDKHKPGLKVIVTESLFSMEGDFAPLEQLVVLAKRFGAELIVDEAHATGVFGGGLVSSLGLSQKVLATVHTGGKALGLSGAWVAGSHTLKEYLLNFSRSQIFSTAVSPWLAASLQEAVFFYAEVGDERAKDLQRKTRIILEKIGFNFGKNLSPIIPWFVENPQIALETAQMFQNRGMDVRAIRPPSVLESGCRLRITVKSTNTDEEMHNLAAILLMLRGLP